MRAFAGRVALKLRAACNSAPVPTSMIIETILYGNEYTVELG